MTEPPGILAKRHGFAQKPPQRFRLPRAACPWVCGGAIAMQFQLVSTYTAAFLGVDAVADGIALLVLPDGTASLIYAEEGVNDAESLGLDQVGDPGSGFMSASSLPTPIPVQQPGSGMAVQVAGSQTRVFLFDSHTAALRSVLIDANGVPGAASVVSTSSGALTGVETFEILGGVSGSTAALSFWNTPGLKLYALSPSGTLTLQSSLADSAKSYLRDVSDTATVTLNGKDYLLTLSSLENGLTSFCVTSGKANLVDSLGNHDGLAISGPAALQVVEVGGQSFAVIASTTSSSISTVRVNDQGCLFYADQINDDLTTRFAQTQVLDSFTLQGRCFVVSAGTDAGITLLEVMPGGQLSPFYTAVLETGSGLGDVTGLEVGLNGTTLELFVVDARSDRVLNYQIDLSSLGGIIEPTSGKAVGTGLDELIFGLGGNETLQGGGGTDRIVDGAGADTLTGGAGADVFIFCADAAADKITDYEKHHDIIDLSDWGMIYSTAALKITSTGTGATISYGGNTLQLVSVDGHSLAAADFSDSDFIF